MGVALVLLAVGAAGLFAGARAALRGAGILDRLAGVPASAFGALLSGIHLEALATAVAGAGIGLTAIATGQTFGAALLVLTAAFGLPLVTAPDPIPSPPRAVLAAPALGVAAAALSIADRFVGRMEGGLLVALYVFYVVLMARGPQERSGASAEEEGHADPSARPEADGRDGGPAGSRGGTSRSPGLRGGLLVGGGLVGLSVGAVAAVQGGARVVAETLFLPGFVGATVVAAVASLDRVLTAVRSAPRDPRGTRAGEPFTGMGAVTTGVLGLAALVRPLTVDSGVTASFLALALVYAVVGTAFFARGRAGRGVGALVLTAFVAWLLWGSSL